jgi:hypothetical protein
MDTWYWHVLPVRKSMQCNWIIKVPSNILYWTPLSLCSYSNDCIAKCEGVEVKSQGECPKSSLKSCACNKMLAPVCGKDGKT